MSRLFGDPMQLGVIVRDIEKALDHWIKNLGIGPWYYIDKVPITRYAYRGKQYDGVHVSAAISHSGGMQMELIQPRHTIPSVWTDFLSAGHEGINHWASFEPDFDGVCKRALARGLDMVHEGDMARGRFAYFLHPATPNTYIEVAEAHPDRTRMFNAIRDAARDWDGTDPIRYTSPV
jgi:Glyoxalase/Bleomycin resistance protein/Dioxygenase superfamily